MSIALLVFLIINSVLLFLFVSLLISMISENRTKLWKRNGYLENNSRELGESLIKTERKFKEYVKKYPVKSKYKNGDVVFFKDEDFTYNGTICAVVYKNTNTFDYLIDYKGRTITAHEENIYLEKH